MSSPSTEQARPGSGSATTGAIAGATRGAGLKIENLRVSVADGEETLVILDGVNLTVEPGDLVCITGSSGSGKSTLMGVAGLLRTAQSGTVSIAGRDTTGLSRSALAKIRLESIGLVFQSSNLFPSLTALEQLELISHIAGNLDKSAKKRAADLLDSVGLSKRRNARPAQLSGGERQRVGIARALMNNPSILLADEPTASLDDARGRVVMGILAEQAHELGVATVVVTHAPEQLPQATKRLHLDRGTLIDPASVSN
ncbi:MAG TPA: ABC transporter ATP-binding protein [Microthrixaceae bacterium]|nr:ABC transporter ATP-binding protein [Microthrixaceae bacterium]